MREVILDEVSERAWFIEWEFSVGGFVVGVGVVEGVEDVESEGTICGVLLDDQGEVIEIVEGDFDQANLDQLAGAMD